jgi:hypothetical protein
MWGKDLWSSKPRIARERERTSVITTSQRQDTAGKFAGSTRTESVNGRNDGGRCTGKITRTNLAVLEVLD